MIVDDDEDNLSLVRCALEYEGYKVVSAMSGEEALAKLSNLDPDLIILDINMPGLSGLEVLKKLRLREKYVAVIFVTARAETQDVILGLDAGANDYICKPFDPLELLARVRSQLRIKDLNDNLAEANARLQTLVDIDDVTDLYNMRSVYQRIEIEISRARRHGRQVAVVMMDMDDFKKVNDNHDHLFGSFVLREVGQLIRENVRQIDFAARYGGDEFLICLTETNLEGSQRFAERLRALIAAYDFKNENSQMRQTVSLGVALTAPGDKMTDARSLVRYADNALYEAKAAGKNCVRFFSGDTRLRIAKAN